MPSAASLHIIQSSEASARLREAERWLAARADRGALIVSASRGAADDLARAVARRPRGDGRPAPVQLRATGRAPRGAGPRGARHRAGHAHRLGGGRRARHVRRPAGWRARPTSAPSPARPASRARWRARSTIWRWPASSRRRCGELPLGGADLARLLEGFDEQFAAASATGRAALFTAACEGVGGAVPPARSSCSTSRWNRRSSSSWRKHLIAAAPETLVTVPFGDLATLDASRDARRLGRDTRAVRRLGSRRRCADRSSPARQPPEREPLGDVRLFSAPGEGRECVEIARRILDEVARRRALRRDGGLPALAARVPRAWSRTRSSAPASTPGSIAARAGRIRPAARSSRSSAAPSSASRRSASPSTSRWRRCPRPARSQSAEVLPPADDLIAGFAGIERLRRRRRPEAAVLPLQRSRRRRSPQSSKAALRAPWKWERLIVEASVVGGDPERWRRRLRGLREGYEARIKRGTACAKTRSRRGSQPRARSPEPRAPRALRAARSSRRSRPGRRSATWGEWLERFGELAPRVLRRPARVLRVLGELRAMAPSARSRSRRRATCWPNACARSTSSRRPTATGASSSAARTRRAAARSRSCSCPASPSGSSRRSCARIRCSSTRRCARRSRQLGARLASRTIAPRPSGSCSGSRSARRPIGCGSRIRASTSAAPARACPRSTCSTSCAPSSARSRTTRSSSGDAAAAGGAKLDWPAPARPEDAIDEVEHDLATLRLLIDTPDRGGGSRPCALPARPQPGAPPVGHETLGAGAIAVAGRRTAWCA